MKITICFKEYIKCYGRKTNLKGKFEEEIRKMKYDWWDGIKKGPIENDESVTCQSILNIFLYIYIYIFICLVDE